MTTLKILLSLIILFCAGFAIHIIWKSKSCFEIKVIYWFTSNDNEREYYKVVFRNNKWQSYTELLELKDYTEDYIHIYDRDFSGNKEECIEFAKKFKSYEDCVNNNKFVKKKSKELEAIHKANGVPTYDEWKNKHTYVVPTEKEIIIKSCK